MATNSNSSQNTSDDNLPQKKFAFVEHESNKRELRSHAMREHWKNRRQTMNEEKQKRQKRTQHTLLPTPTTQSTMSDENSESSSSVLNTNASSDTALIPNNELKSDLEGIPHQILSGANLAYWGTEAEWIIHHKGLMNLVEARGSIAALSSNWRLELTTFLVSLMTRPTWFDCSNQIQELLTHVSELSSHPILRKGSDLRNLRSLWLLSFIQDIGTFRTNLLRTTPVHYSAFHEAILLLKTHRQDNELDTVRPELCSDLEFTRLACLLFICVLLQRSPADSPHDIGTYQEGGWSFQRLDNLNLLNFCLEANHLSWHDSLENLNSILFFHFSASEGTGLDPDYVRSMATVLASLSGGARYAVERCLLETLCRASGGEQNLLEEKFTPDILLSTISGQ
ncbi:hypothetical protein CEK25_012948 [Fusarium fujikuroi]|nr:hypothetical protein CEK25_012948 [Fusarium fujikuroi]